MTSTIFSDTKVTKRRWEHGDGNSCVFKGFDGYRRFFGRSQWSVVWNLIVTCAILPSLYMYNIPLHPYLIMYITGSKIICSDIEIDLSNSAKQATSRMNPVHRPWILTHSTKKTKTNLNYIENCLPSCTFSVSNFLLRFCVSRSNASHCCFCFWISWLRVETYSVS